MKARMSLPIDGKLMSWHMVSLRMVHIKPTLLPLRTSFRLFELIEKVKSVASVMRKRLMFLNIKFSLVKSCQLEIVSTLKPLEEIIWENVFCLGGNRDHIPACLYLCFIVLYTLKDSILPITWRNEWSGSLSKLERKPRRDRGTRRGRPSTSSSTFDQPSSSHLNDDDDDGNDEGTSCASTPFPIRYVNSLTNQVPQNFQNPPNIDPHLEPFYTRQTKIINRQVQLRDEQHGGVRSIEKSLRRLWRNM
ncbi:hypothetical protein Tco_0809217 [Tanacetum coccineum]